MPISKDEQYRIYNFGIEEGRDIVKSYLDGEDVIDVILEAFSEKQAKRVENSSFEELKLAVNNFHDGVEDGIKLQLGKEAADYIKWLRDND
jgi:hypothetical protein